MVEDWLCGTAEREEWNELGGYQIHFYESRRLTKTQSLISNQVRRPAELKHLTKQRKRK